MDRMGELYYAGDLEGFINLVTKKCRQKISRQGIAGYTHDDVVQEVSIRVVLAMKKHVHAKAAVNTYVDRVTNNVIRDLLRKARNQCPLIYAASLSENREVENEVQMGWEDVSYDNLEFYMTIEDLFDAREKEILHLYLDGYSFSEIASYLGVTKARVSQLWSQIKTKYADFLTFSS